MNFVYILPGGAANLGACIFIELGGFDVLNLIVIASGFDLKNNIVKIYISTPAHDDHVHAVLLFFTVGCHSKFIFLYFLKKKII